jgi:hypothetical protein
MTDLPEVLDPFNNIISLDFPDGVGMKALLGLLDQNKAAQAHARMPKGRLVRVLDVHENEIDDPASLAAIAKQKAEYRRAYRDAYEARMKAEALELGVSVKELRRRRGAAAREARA